MKQNSAQYFSDNVNTNPLTHFFWIRHNMYDNGIDIIMEAFAINGPKTDSCLVIWLFYKTKYSYIKKVWT